MDGDAGHDRVVAERALAVQGPQAGTHRRYNHRSKKNYYESVVIDYLRADRAVFVNTECCIQINPSDNPDPSGPHWYCDAVALDFRAEMIFLCEISYAVRLSQLINRLKGWNDHWDGIRTALERDSHIPALSWPVLPWLFVPKCRVGFLEAQLKKVEKEQPLKFQPKITALERVQPWCYPNFNRKGDCFVSPCNDDD
jgi:hypothetical protein